MLGFKQPVSSTKTDNGFFIYKKMNNIVLVKNEKLVVSSRKFAEGFDVQHKNHVAVFKATYPQYNYNFLT